jgi:hypothetical protein
MAGVAIRAAAITHNADEDFKLQTITGLSLNDSGLIPPGAGEAAKGSGAQ